MQKRCDKNRNRSKRRSIYCPIHGCYIDSVSKKYPLFADRVEQLQQRGMLRQNALRLVASRTTVPLHGEWVEAFWCNNCQQTKWYHLHKTEIGTFEVSSVTRELWQFASGTIDSGGNPSVSEFTRREARLTSYSGLNEFQFIR